MKCVITVQHPPALEDEAIGIRIRVDATAISGQDSKTLNAEVVIPFTASQAQMTTSIKDKVRAEFLTAFGLNITSNETFLIGGNIS
jgi:hypothetical protein